MSDAQPPEPIWLVPLVDAAPDASQQSRILQLAADRALPSLYIQMPPGKAAYADTGRRGVHDGITWQAPQKVSGVKRPRIPSITTPTICRDADYLALAPEDARRIATVGSAYVQQFIGVVKIVPGQDGFELRPAVICLRPAVGQAIRSSLILDLPEHAIRVELRDVLLDRRVMELLADPTNNTIAPKPSRSEVARTGTDSVGRWDLPAYVPFEDVPEEDQPLPPPVMWHSENDPFNLRSRAPGVFVLFAAAKHFFGSEDTKSIKQQAVADWIKKPSAPVHEWISTQPGKYKKLANKTNTRLAFKLLHPKHDEQKGSKPKRTATPLSGDALGRAAKYRDGTLCISERFSLVLLTVDYWQELLSGDVAHDTSRIPTERLTKYVNRLFTEIEIYGFTTDEEKKAVVHFVIWPHYIPELDRQSSENMAAKRNALAKKKGALKKAP